MAPRGDLSSTGFALANPGQEYLVLEPGDTDDPFTVTLAAGTYAVEWFGLDRRETAHGDQVTVDRSGPVGFTGPLASTPAVLYLRRAGR
jgi:hypothetical protein